MSRAQQIVANIFALSILCVSIVWWAFEPINGFTAFLFFNWALPRDAAASVPVFQVWRPEWRDHLAVPTSVAVALGCSGHRWGFLGLVLGCAIGVSVVELWRQIRTVRELLVGRTESGALPLAAPQGPAA
jgi:hypothetical protein